MDVTLSLYWPLVADSARVCQGRSASRCSQCWPASGGAPAYLVRSAARFCLLVFSRSGKLYNGGNGGRITLNQAWALLQKMEGVSIPALYAAPRAGDVRDSQADTTAAIRDLGYAPRFSFEEGMRRTLEWYRG